MNDWRLGLKTLTRTLEGSGLNFGPCSGFCFPSCYDHDDIFLSVAVLSFRVLPLELGHHHSHGRTTLARIHDQTSPQAQRLFNGEMVLFFRLGLGKILTGSFTSTDCNPSVSSCTCASVSISYVFPERESARNTCSSIIGKLEGGTSRRVLMSPRSCEANA